ncbi:hypothetical protein OAU29_01875 [Porticoccaceae bacterium]|nr:hypothetical protein [Porticoccaceae bacterium]|tara:strand:+ start:4951 stop:5601 length:651 start_codon:yes stop_codon:yes gene_type:complete
MAANEHKNLQDANRHNPLGYESANNETVLSKGAGSSADARDGVLQWASRSTMGVTNYKMQGYTTGTANFQHGEDVADNKSPFLIDVDYGSTTVAGGSLSPSAFFRMGQGYVAPENANVSSIDGWLTSNTANVVVIAICKVTPSPSSTANVVPTIIDEFEVTGGASNSLLVSINQTEISTPLIRQGDIIFPMIKDSSGSSIYMNLTIQTMTFTPQIS